MTPVTTETHVLYALCNAQIKLWPFPHFFVEDVFPDDVYQGIQEKLAAQIDYKSVEGHYPNRKFSDIERFPEFKFMESRDFLQNATSIFSDIIKARYTGKKLTVFHDMRLVRDTQGYGIGPHTDARWKLISFLFYLPAMWANMKHGTSLYLPKNRQEGCPGGPHHLYERFDRVATMPYIPNSCFGFLKTDVSFHGVEPIPTEIRRDVLLYNIYDQEIYLQAHPNSMPPTEANSTQE